MSTRDLLSWINFINTCSIPSTQQHMADNVGNKVLLPPALAYIHGACLVFLDALGSGLTSLSSSSASNRAVKDVYQTCLGFLRKQVACEDEEADIEQISNSSTRPEFFGVSPFFILRGMFRTGF